MKKLSLLGAVLAVLLSPLAFTSTSYATGTCPVGFTGPSSTNICTSTTAHTCTVANDNQVTVDNTNQQIAVSGSAAGNGTLTGSATNANGVTYSATVTNGDGQQTCSVVATTAPITPVVVPPVQQPTTTSHPASAPVKPAVLADTATISPAVLIASLIGTLGAGMIMARLAISLYGHFRA